MKKKIESLLVVIFLVVSFASPTSAYQTWGSSHLINGVGQSGNNTRYYWLDSSSLNATWKQRVSNAMNAWCNTGSQGCGVYTSVWFHQTTSKASSVVDFYREDNLDDGVYGQTFFFRIPGDENSEIFPYNAPQNWVWTKISINVYFCNHGNTIQYYEPVPLTTIQKRVLVEHEIGHAFGLAHLDNNNDMNKVMYSNTYFCTAVQPTADDCYGVNSLYGGYNP